MQIYEELAKANAEINVLENKAYITGVKNIDYLEAEARDLREAAALVIASICNGGKIKNIEIASRGYEALFYKLYIIGVRFKIKNER